MPRRLGALPWLFRYDELRLHERRALEGIRDAAPSHEAETLDRLLGSVSFVRRKLGGKEASLDNGPALPVLCASAQDMDYRAYGGCRLEAEGIPILAELMLEYGRPAWLQFSRPVRQGTAVESMEARVYQVLERRIDRDGSGLVGVLPPLVADAVRRSGAEILASTPATEQEILDMEWRLGRPLAAELLDALHGFAQARFGQVRFFGPAMYRTMDPETNYFVLAAPPLREVELDIIEYRASEGFVVVDQLEDDQTVFGDALWEALHRLIRTTGGGR